MSSKTREVDDYLASLDPERRAALTELRSLILETMPDAVETMKYRMPTYEYRGRVLCSFACQKHHMSLYMDPKLVKVHREELVGLNVGKSRLRFRRLEQLPLDAVRTMMRETIPNNGRVRS
jgi:uncharacterized protein YdhG (YjbR/CyaY superfamily)